MGTGQEKTPAERRFTAQRNLVEVQMAAGEWGLGRGGGFVHSNPF